VTISEYIFAEQVAEGEYHFTMGALIGQRFIIHVFVGLLWLVDELVEWRGSSV
jgi:hypothetical protein